MEIIILVTALAVVVSAFVFVYYWVTQREYRPSVAKVRRILQSSLDETLDPDTFDEFSIVRIEYRPELDEIRKRFNVIVTDPRFMKHRFQDDRFVALNPGGKAEMKALLKELDLLAA